MDEEAQAHLKPKLQFPTEKRGFLSKIVAFPGKIRFSLPKNKLTFKKLQKSSVRLKSNTRSPKTNSNINFDNIHEL